VQHSWMRLGSLGPARGRRTRTVRDLVRFGAVILTAPVSRYSVRPRGAEARRPLPGDELLPAAKDRWTHAVTIRGRPGDIWPWLAQMGCRRAGWYSPDGLDNGGVRSAERVVPALQSVDVGGLFPWTSTAEDGFLSMWSNLGGCSSWVATLGRFIASGGLLSLSRSTLRGLVF
jgi:hypothetical protein